MIYNDIYIYSIHNVYISDNDIYYISNMHNVYTLDYETCGKTKSLG